MFSMFNRGADSDGAIPPHRRRILPAAIGAALLAAAAYHSVSAVPAGGPTVEPPAATAERAIPQSFSALIARVQPAVVNVSTTGKVSGVAFENGGPEFEFPPGSPFGEMFRHFFGPQGEGRGPSMKRQAVGSGFIIDPKGYIVTNGHVIDGADEITVILNDGTRYPAKVRGVDTKTDLALLSIEPTVPLTAVQFGNSDRMQAGDWVVAIGNPFGLGGTATAGIISARGRDIQSGPFDDFLQIDAPINSGNSGGPLFDTEGRVIGVNTAIYSPNGGNVGIGFAIPAAVAEKVVDQLRSDGRVERGWLGVQYQPVDAGIAESLGLPEAAGALVAAVVPDSPAAHAGIEVGDVITAYEGKRIADTRDLAKNVAASSADHHVTLDLWREGKPHTVKVKISTTPDQEQVADWAGSKGGDESAKGELGLQLGQLTPEARRELGLSQDTHGALVMDVREGSPAAEAGLQAGDVITMVGQNKVAHPRDIVEGVRTAKRDDRKSVLLMVEREGVGRFLAVTLS